MRAWLLAAVLAAAAPAALAQTGGPTTQVTPAGVVQIQAGERITVRMPAGGTPEQVSVEKAAPGSALPPKPGAGVFEDAPRGTVVFTFERSGPDVMLKVLSGIDKAFDYQAILTGAEGPGSGAGEPAAVCTVLPLLASYERWPGRGRASGIALSRFRLKDTNGVVCSKPAFGSKAK